MKKFAIEVLRGDVETEEVLLCCGAKNHPSGWKKEKRINSKATRRKLKIMTDKGE